MRHIRIVHNPNSLLCNSGTVKKIIGVVAHRRGRGKQHARTHIVCNSCGARGCVIGGNFGMNGFDDFVSVGRSQASKRQPGSSFGVAGNFTGLKCTFGRRCGVANSMDLTGSGFRGPNGAFRPIVSGGVGVLHKATSVTLRGGRNGVDKTLHLFCG